MGFIIIDPDTKRPMSASRALALLEETNALEKLRASGYYADEFRAAVPPPEVQGGSCLSCSPSVLTASIFQPYHRDQVCHGGWNSGRSHRNHCSCAAPPVCAGGSGPVIQEEVSHQTAAGTNTQES